MRLSAALTPVVAAAPTALAWGAMGHQAIAYIATNFVSASTKTYFQGLLGDTSGDYLAAVSTWADSYRSTTAGKFSAPFHYIDANDSPPSSCGVELARDCGKDGCVVSAIANYTSQLLDGKLSKAQRQIAAKMIIHFVGDVGQPLHCENLDKGGNDIAVTYDGDGTNLHAVWDTAIPAAVAGGSSRATAKAWAANLTAAVRTGAFKTASAGWFSAGTNVSAPAVAALAWARESNAHVCSTVLAGGLAFVEDTDLAGDYTRAAAPVVDEQVAKQGFRLAKWLDAIAAAAS